MEGVDQKAQMAHAPRTALPIGLSRRAALRIGYASIIALLVFASVEAYRIQDRASTRHLDIYRHYAQQEEAMSALRYSVWLAGNYVRDFFIDTRPETAELLKQQLTQVKSDSEAALRRLDELKTLENPELRASLKEFWDTLLPTPQTMLHTTDAEQYAFVQREIAPRRSTLYNALRELLRSDQAHLQRSEGEFESARRASGFRLVLMLGVCVAMALVVARFSLAHAESLERSTQQQYEEVAQAKEQLEQLSARLVEIEEEGRKRLSRELHDEIGQALAVLQIEISHANALPDDRLPELRQRLLRARALAERTVQTVRGMSLELRPALLDDLGLIPALQWLLEDFMRRSGVQCKFSTAGIDEHLPEPLITCVYRVVQEAVHNCEKHAGASIIRVDLRQTGDVMIVEVEDNGRGFAAGGKGRPWHNAGLGILGMRERAARLGGTLSLDAAPGRGTHLVLTIPCPVKSLGPQSSGAAVKV